MVYRCVKKSSERANDDDDDDDDTIFLHCVLSNKC